MKIILTALLALALVGPACKKDKKEAKKDDTAATKPADTEPADKPADTVPADKPADAKPMAPKVELTGTPSENLIAVFKAGVEAIATGTAAEAAATLNATLAAYNVEEIRAASKAAKEAGKGATDEQKKQFAELKDAYKKRAEELGKEDPAAFGDAAAAWAKAWGIN